MVMAVILNIATIAIGFFTQRIFLHILGAEYMGLNSLFANILSALAVAELGIGNAIIFSMYKPMAEDDETTVRALMAFYKRCYAIIGLIVLVLGLAILPFTPEIVGEQSLGVSVQIIFAISLADIVFSYYLGYKRSIIFVAQQNYIIDFVGLIYIILLSSLQMLVLFITKNYYLYLLVKLALRILQNVVLNTIAGKMFPYIKEPNPPALSKKIRKDIAKKVKGLIYHKVASFVVLGTDNIIITTFLGLFINGLYASYYMIINSVQGVIYQIITATMASVGNLLVENDKKKQFGIFRKIRFMNFWLATLGAAGFIIVMDSFVSVWLGTDFLLSFEVLIVLAINSHMTMMRTSYGVFKEAAGIFYEDRFVPLIESAINIVASVVLVQIMGLPGVFLGTILSGLVLYVYSYPKFVYKKLFGGSYKKYIFETVGLALLAAVICVVSLFASRAITGAMGLTGIPLVVANIAIVLVIPNLLMLVCFAKNDNLKFFINKVRRKNV
jgi:O-antigen/teichoic acid export membrane protein